MKPVEILALLPGIGGMGAYGILDFPAWKMLCRHRNSPATLVRDAGNPSSSIAFDIAIGDEQHVLAVVENPAFPELSALQGRIGRVPEPVVLALAEKECGDLLQTLENILRRELKLVGLNREGGAERCAFFALSSADGGPPVRFGLEKSDLVAATLGVARNIDHLHESVRSMTVQAAEIRSRPVLGSDELAAISPGAFVLMPEFSQDAPGTVAEFEIPGIFEIGANGVSRISGETAGALVIDTEPREMALGMIFDMAEGSVPPQRREKPEDGRNLELRLPDGRTAFGKACSLGGQCAMEIESIK